jgi:hypothetical protein
MVTGFVGKLCACAAVAAARIAVAARKARLMSDPNVNFAVTGP